MNPTLTTAAATTAVIAARTTGLAVHRQDGFEYFIDRGNNIAAFRDADGTLFVQNDTDWLEV